MAISRRDIEAAYPTVKMKKGAREKLYPPYVEYGGKMVPVQLVEKAWRKGQAPEPEHRMVDTHVVEFTDSDGQQVERIVAGTLADVAEFLHNHAVDASGVVRSSTARWEGNL